MVSLQALLCEDWPDFGFLHDWGDYQPEVPLPNLTMMALGLVVFQTFSFLLSRVSGNHLRGTFKRTEAT